MQQILRKISLLWVYLAGLLLLIIVLMTVINISSFALDRVARLFATNVSGLPGYEDLVRLLISCISLMLFPWAQLEKAHIMIDFFTNNVAKKNIIIIDKIWLVTTFVLACFLAFMMYEGMLESFDDGALSRVLGWSEWPFYIPGIISLVLWAVILLYQVFTLKIGDKNA